MPYDLDRHLMEFRVNGFTVFADLIPHDKIERIQEAWAPIRNADIEAQGEYPPRGWGRYNVRVPFADPSSIQISSSTQLWSPSSRRSSAPTMPGRTTTPISHYQAPTTRVGIATAKPPPFPVS